MVFPSVPLYLDPPNWNHQHQQAQQQPAGNGGHDYHHLQPGSAQQSEGPMAPQASRPGSMADRARLAKLPQPEPAALKCPRCDSTNTKFCYFNNYSLSQPRHFCKTCRRYWTRGGALRNVPVGGGCRRNNKRSKSSGSSSKSQSANATSSSSASATAMIGSIGGAAPTNLVSAPQMPFMASLHHLGEYGAPNLGLNFTGMQPIDVDYQVGGSSSVELEQWRIQQIQQFPFFGGMEAAAPAPPVQGLYAFDDHGEGGGGVDTSVFTVAPRQAQKGRSSSGLITQMSSVKMEDSSKGLNLQRPYLSMARNEQFWGGGADGVGGSGGISGGIGGNSVGGWMTNLSGFNSSSSGSLL